MLLDFRLNLKNDDFLSLVVHLYNSILIFFALPISFVFKIEYPVFDLRLHPA